MKKTIPVLLAEHIDSVVGVDTTGGITRCFREDGSLGLPDSSIAFQTAATLLQYEEDEHDEYTQNVYNVINDDKSVLSQILNAVDSFKMPETNG